MQTASTARTAAPQAHIAPGGRSRPPAAQRDAPQRQGGAALPEQRFGQSASLSATACENALGDA